MIDNIYETKKLLPEIFKKHKNILVSFSGGKDSTVLLNLIKELGLIDKCRVVFFDTGMEYEATYNFIKMFNNVEWVKPKKPLPLIKRDYGIPFYSKYVSDMLERLQKHNFDFKNDTFKEYDELIKKYPKCSGGLKWLCRKNIVLNCPKKLKQKLPELNFKITSKCCWYLKKDLAHKYNKENNIDLVLTGIRRDEGGIRAMNYKKCYFTTKENTYYYLPLLNWTDEDVDKYIKDNDVILSLCYTLYGLKRTGCVGCPFSKEWEQEREILKKYEPNKSVAIENLFKETYEFQKGIK